MTNKENFYSLDNHDESALDYVKELEQTIELIKEDIQFIFELSQVSSNVLIKNKLKALKNKIVCFQSKKSAKSTESM